MQWVIAAHIILVQSAVVVAACGLLLLVVGGLLDGASPGTGTRLRRFGVQGIGASLFVLVGHTIVVEFFGTTPPFLVLVLMYGIVLLMLFQAFVNLLFGPSVGSRVTADLLTSLLRYSMTLISLPFEAIRRAMRKP